VLIHTPRTSELSARLLLVLGAIIALTVPGAALAQSLPSQGGMGSLRLVTR